MMPRRMRVAVRGAVLMGVLVIMLITVMMAYLMRMRVNRPVLVSVLVFMHLIINHCGSFS